MQTVLLFTMMAVAALLLSGCSVTIKDETFCSPVPGNFGAVCDNFLTSKQQILDEAEWVALQASWISDGEAVECTTSKTLGDIKAEVEKLCSVAKCNVDTQAAIIDGLNKIQNLGKN